MPWALRRVEVISLRKSLNVSIWKEMANLFSRNSMVNMIFEIYENRPRCLPLISFQVALPSQLNNLPQLTPADKKIIEIKYRYIYELLKQAFTKRRTILKI